MIYSYLPPAKNIDKTFNIELERRLDDGARKS